MPQPVQLRVPRGPMFVGAYAKVPVVIDSGSRLKLEDLEFVVPAGPKGGRVSLSRDREFDAKRPDVMFLAGYAPGTYVLQARKKGTTTVVGEAKFELTTQWKDDRLGPPRWLSSIGRGYAAGAAWGGGPAGPQNSNVVPASGTRRIAILLVDTSSQRFSADAATVQGHRDRWLNEILNGVTTGGVTRSLRAFYREASYNTFDISAQVFGPVQLPDAFDDYFKDGTPKGGYYQACVTAGDGVIDYNNFDTLLCVSQPVDGPPRKAAWPYASIGNWGPYPSAEGDRYLGVISITNDWGVGGDREIYETASHEFGHNLGLGDQYTPAVPGRNVGDWDMMAGDDAFPHFSIAHRLMLGWVQPAWVRSFNFSSMASPVDQTVTLHPIEQGAPPAGRSTGLEIRLADGWNYYFEYRAGQVAQIGDRNLPTDSRVLATDVASSPYAAPIARPAILLLNNDGDGDGAVLGNGQDYEETDTTDPVFPTDFKVDASGIDGTKADVRVRYGVNSRPDPSIRPWPAGPERQWQSPDIEVRNPRNAADPVWFNVPWEGNANTVVARIKNAGGLDAPAVRANFFVKNYNVGGTPETFLGFDVHDVPKGATVEFTSTWTPPDQGHYCIIVRIPLYQLPADPTVVELTELNNVAQSNYDRYISRTASPASREIGTVEVGNPYAMAARIFIVAWQTNPLYRTYLEAGWLTLNPGETRHLRVMYEYGLDPKEPPRTDERRRDLQKFGKASNRVSLTAFIEDPRDNPRHSLQMLGGAQSEVTAGRATQFIRFEVKASVARGVVATTDDKKPVPKGRVLVVLTVGRGTAQQKHYGQGKIDRGKFAVDVPSAAKGGTARAYYVPATGFADCWSKQVDA